MRIFSLFFWTSIILLIFTGIAFVIYNVSVEDNFFKDQAYKQLINVADSKSERVADFLENRKNDAEFLAESKDVKKAFGSKLVQDAGIISKKIKEISEETANDVGDYIAAHPDMTLKDLQESEEFRRIALRPVGKTGYTVFSDYRNQTIVLHPFPQFIGLTNETWVNDYPDIYRIFNGTINGEPSYGFYDWEDTDGVIRKKYTHFAIVEERTADGIGLTSNANTYLDEFGDTMILAENLDIEFRSFQKFKGYSDLILISPEGDVVWTAERHDELGTNLQDGRYNASLLANMFREARDNLEIEIGYFGRYSESEELSLFITVPVVDTDVVSGKNKLIGVLALELSSDKISDLITSDVGLGEKGEVYVVNQYRDHVTSLKTNVLEESEQIHYAITSERIESCFRDYDNYYASLKGERVDKVSKFGDGLNYAGEEVLGAHSYILGSGWCVITEMSKSDFEEDVNHINIILAIIILSVFFVGILVAFILDNLYRIERKDAKK